LKQLYGGTPGKSVQNGLGGLAKKVGQGITGTGPKPASGGFAAGLVKSSAKPGGFAAGLVGGAATSKLTPGQTLGGLWGASKPAPIASTPITPYRGGGPVSPSPGGGSADSPISTPVGPGNIAPASGDTGGTSISPLLILGAGALAVLFLKKKGRGGLKL
jgi:hypothetical protein